MIGAWSLLAARKRAIPDVDVVLIGTDPVCGVLAAPMWKRMRPPVKVAHWCFDLYPECALADGLLREGQPAVRLLRRMLTSAYRACDLVVDLGACMREALSPYLDGVDQDTLVPWALAEPDRVIASDAEERKTLFGSASLGLLYSGNFGRAHTYEAFLGLARELSGSDIRMAFSARGNRFEALEAHVRPGGRDDVNVVDFAPPERLQVRLGAADIHLVSLHEDWTGAVVPSKFFGSLAVGRPVVFAGSPQASIARWIEHHRVGWVLRSETVGKVAGELRQLSRSRVRLRELQAHCRNIYHAHFSKARMIDGWHQALLQQLGRTSELPQPDPDRERVPVSLSV